MKNKIHLAAGILATLCIASFFCSTVIVEIFGSYEAIARVKNLIVFPGLFILIPAIAATGASGFVLSKNRHSQLVKGKKQRMPIIAANGILILIPSAIYLKMLASSNSFNYIFFATQFLELSAGATNIILMSLNMRDGFKLKGH